MAVLIDVALVSRTRALWFSLWGVALAMLSVALNFHFGGPYFLTELLAPRAYSLRAGLLNNGVGFLGPLLVPLALGAYMAWSVSRNPQRRIVSLLFLTSLCVGTIFSAGQGVSVNTYFSTFFAASMAIGLFFAHVESHRWKWTMHSHASYAPALLFLWLLIPAELNNIENPAAALRQTVARQGGFDAATAFLRQQPGPAICENLLVCFYAGKPYVYDPFNATRLIEQGKLDPKPMLSGFDQRQFGAVELERHPPEDTDQADRFSPEVLRAIQSNYQPALSSHDLVIYLPKRRTLVSEASTLGMSIR